MQWRIQDFKKGGSEKRATLGRVWGACLSLRNVVHRRETGTSPPETMPTGTTLGSDRGWVTGKTDPASPHHYLSPKHYSFGGRMCDLFCLKPRGSRSLLRSLDKTSIILSKSAQVNLHFKLG